MMKKYIKDKENEMIMNYKIKRTCGNCGFEYITSTKKLVYSEWEPSVNRCDMYCYVRTECTQCESLQFFDIDKREMTYEEQAKYDGIVRLYRWLKSILKQTK